MGDELWWGQAQNGANFYFDLKFDLEGQSQLLPKTIGILTNVQIWWSQLEWVMSYGEDKLKMGQIFTLTLNLTLKVKVDYPPKQ